ncbi:hypothetical protein ACWEV3_25105 [Saccharopolyspora sp. NPDC003752]
MVDALLWPVVPFMFVIVWGRLIYELFDEYRRFRLRPGSSRRALAARRAALAARRSHCSGPASGHHGEQREAAE